MTRTAHRQRHRPGDAGTDTGAPLLPEVLTGCTAVAIGGANVIMQLSRLPVGRGVAESRVDSGRVDKHPLKRFRTTFTYIAVAAGGSDAERLAMRHEVGGAHRQVRSSPADPVRYDAFDPQDQLWVAACLYRGVELMYTLLYGPPDDATADVLYRESARFGTTLQVPESEWPADRSAFDAYWSAGIEAVELDDVTRAYLRSFAGLGFLPLPLRATAGTVHQFLATGFLPEPFRRELGLPWDPGRQLGFDVLTRASAAVVRRLPSPVRTFPFNYLLWDFRRRQAAGRPVV